MLRRRNVAMAGLLSIPALRASLAAWPERPIRLLIPFAAGGGLDTVARIVAERLSERLGRSVLPENRPGAGGSVTMEAVARSTPDGYTIAVAGVPVWAINQFLYARLSYDSDRDLIPVGLAWEQVNLMAVAAAHTPVRTVAEFLAWAAERRGRLTYGHAGIGTTTQMSAALFNTRHALGATAIPYRGGAAIIPAMLSGDITYCFDSLSTFAGLLPEGNIRALAITGAERWPTQPELPTMAEAGVRDFVVSAWVAFAAQARTPREIIDRLGAAMRSVFSEAETQARVLRAGARLKWSSPEEVRARIEQERPTWREMVRISGAQLQ